MKTIDKYKPIMITGATGYVAGWIVKKLLDEGLTVHAPIRNSKDKEKTQYLDAIAKKTKGKLIYFEADLLEEGSYDDAIQGCELVIHTASPSGLTAKNPKKELFDPALKGTQNVLNSVNNTNSVKRVVLTSSTAAIVGDAIELIDYPNQTATEEHWNKTSSLQHSPYNYSKTMAEKEAWKMVEAQNKWDLVVINPSLVLGPGINPYGTSVSFTIVQQIGNGTMKIGAPDLNMSFVDVRDVADAHFKACFTPSAKGRYIVSGHNSNFLHLASILREKLGNAKNKKGKLLPFPTQKMSKMWFLVLGPLNGLSIKYVNKNSGYSWLIDNSKGIKELGLTYRPLDISIVEFIQQMLDHKIL